VKLFERLWAWAVRTFARLTKWAEALGNFWAKYWLAIAGTFFVVGSTVLKWIESPFTSDLKGLQIPIFHPPTLLPHMTLLSFGIIGILILVAGLFVSRYSLIVAGATAAILLTIFALVPAQIAFIQPTMLQRLTEEDQTMPLENSFNKKDLPQNYGAAEIIPKRMTLYSAWGRFVAAWSFLRLGWYCFGLGAALIAVYALSKLRGQRGVITLACLGLPLAALAIVALPALVGQLYFSRGALAKAEGRNEDAIANFRTSMRWDTWNALSIDLYGTIGELQKLANISYDSPERHISTALAMEKLSNYEQAVFELDLAARDGGRVAIAARREAARAHILLGLALYNANGYGGAISNWQQALVEDPDQVYELPYLARAYYNVGNFEASIDTVIKLVPYVRDHNQSLADAYSLAADSSAKIGRFDDARDYFNLSLAVDPIENYWALTGLAGE
jgi:tetratricopeptide (TPR) repeat protein